jgi:23S rRNA (adenine2503-C2)-methyltransferase
MDTDQAVELNASRRSGADQPRANRRAGRGRPPRTRYDLSRDELAALLVGEPSYRATQLRDGLYNHLAEPSELTELPRALRERLVAAPELEPGLETVQETMADDGQTVKWLFSCRDENLIETVLMHHAHHSTVCVSSQAGCAMRCQFCATGDAGFTRHLGTGEILEQVVRAARRARADGRRLDHVVFMGMGEPFANFDRVWLATEAIVGDLGLSARHVTLSTVGLVPEIRKLATKTLPVNLAVSLHAANDELRNVLVPINRRYPIPLLVEALRQYRAAHDRRISFEWALIDGVNDRRRDAEELAEIAFALRAHVNLIPLNPTAIASAHKFRGAPPVRVRAFRDAVAAHGVAVTVRRTRGQSIDAACGQLAGTFDDGRPRDKVGSPAR